ncbi:hypothetical protein ACHAPT_013532 [Fusarium lateritium]
MFIKAPAVLIAVSTLAFPSLTGAVTVKHINKDVIVVGGGAAGAYAAVLLREDHGKSIVLIEKEVNTWTEPETGIPYELRVKAFLNYGKAKDFFARFNVSVEPYSTEPVKNCHADFSTGQGVQYTAPTDAERTAAFQIYVDVVGQYEDYMLPGPWNFPTPDKIPQDLLLPFGQFAKKHGIEAVVPTIWETSAVALGEITSQPTFVIQSFPVPLAQAYLGKAELLLPVSRRNQDIYDKVAESLGDDVLYGNVVINAKRTSRGVTVLSKGTDGHLTKITAKRLLVAIAPTLPNLSSFKPDKHERKVLSKVMYTRAYAGAITSSSLPLNTTLKNTDPSGNWLTCPDLSLLQWYKSINSTSLSHKIMMFGNETLDAQDAKAIVEQSFKELMAAGSLENEASDGIEWLEFADHGSVNVRVGLEDLKAGYVQDLYSLQGHLSTWYTGPAWSAQLHTPIWAFSDSVVPRLVESIEE